MEFTHIKHKSVGLQAMGYPNMIGVCVKIWGLSENTVPPINSNETYVHAHNLVHVWVSEGYNELVFMGWNQSQEA